MHLKAVVWRTSNPPCRFVVADDGTTLRPFDLVRIYSTGDSDYKAMHMGPHLDAAHVVL